MAGRPNAALLQARMKTAKPSEYPARVEPGTPSSRTAELRRLLSGRDRRSLAQSATVVARVERDPALVSDLARLARDRNWLVSMRAVDVLEKLAHSHADWVEPHKRLFIGPLADSDRWEIRLQVVRALPLFSWTPRQRARVVEILERDLAHPQKFVRTWALDSLATFALDDASLMRVARRGLESFERSTSPALHSRARRIRARLEGTGR